MICRLKVLRFAALSVANFASYNESQAGILNYDATNQRGCSRLFGAEFASSQNTLKALYKERDVDSDEEALAVGLKTIDESGELFASLSNRAVDLVFA